MTTNLSLKRRAALCVLYEIDRIQGPKLSDRQSRVDFMLLIAKKHNLQTDKQILMNYRELDQALRDNLRQYMSTKGMLDMLFEKGSRALEPNQLQTIGFDEIKKELDAGIAQGLAQDQHPQSSSDEKGQADVNPGLTAAQEKPAVTKEQTSKRSAEQAMIPAEASDSKRRKEAETSADSTEAEAHSKDMPADPHNVSERPRNQRPAMYLIRKREGFVRATLGPPIEVPGEKIQPGDPSVVIEPEKLQPVPSIVFDDEDSDEATGLDEHEVYRLGAAEIEQRLGFIRVSISSFVGGLNRSTKIEQCTTPKLDLYPNADLEACYKILFGEDWMRTAIPLTESYLTGRRLIEACLSAAVSHFVLNQKLPWKGFTDYWKDNADLEFLFNRGVRRRKARYELKALLMQACFEQLVSKRFKRTTIAPMAEELVDRCLKMMQRQLLYADALFGDDELDWADMRLRLIGAFEEALLLKGRLATTPDRFHFAWVANGEQFDRWSMKEMRDAEGERTVLWSLSPKITCNPERNPAVWRVLAPARVVAVPRA